MIESPPRVIIIPDPNGAGKTTFARVYLPKEAGLPVFINADLIAAGLSSFNLDIAAIQAGRIMLTEITEKAARRESFAFETKLSGQGDARHIVEWRELGYRVELFFLSLDSPETAIGPVKSHVEQGGGITCRKIPSAAVLPMASQISSTYTNRL